MIFKEKLKQMRYIQYLVAIVAAFTAASNSTHATWPSPTIPLLKSENSPIGVTVTSDEASWIVSLKNLGAIAGCLGAAFTNQYCGRRISLIMSSVPIFFSWVMIFFAKSVSILFAARFISGLGSGLIASTLPLYTGEIAEKDIRGKLTNFYIVLGLCGDLYVYAVGPFVSYHVLAGTSAILPFFVMVGCWLLPETPYYLAKKGKMVEARKCIVKLSSNCVDENFIEERMDEIRSSLKNDAERKSKFWELVTKKQYRKPFIIITVLKTIQHFSGTQPINAYMQTIIESSKSNFPSSYSSIVFGCTQFLSSLLAGQLVDKVGRKPLLLISTIACGITLFVEGAYFYILEATQEDTGVISWLPLTALVVYELMIAVGISNLPYIIVGELFTMNVKGYASSFSVIYGSTLAFTVNRLYLPISETWGTYSMFWTYGTTCFLGALFVLGLVPETKDKTFDEIQRKLNK